MRRSAHGIVSILATLVLAACATGGTPSNSEPEPRTASDQTSADRRAQVRLELASAYFARGQTETALDELKQALAAVPTLPGAYTLRGLIYAGMGDARVAEDSFLRALQLDARNADAHHNYGWFLCQQRRFPEAEQQFQAALAAPQYRDASRTLLAQGVCQAQAGRLDDAERTLSRSYELDPSSVTTAFNLAQVLYDRADYQRARFYIRRVNQQAEASTAQTLWLALRVERKLGNRPAADELGRELHNRFPQAPEALALQRGRFDD